MSAWPRARLGDCAEIISGSTPKTLVSDYWDGDVIWATPKDLSDLDGHLIAGTSRTISEAGLRSCGASVLPPGSVLFSSRAPIGLVAVNTVPMATNQGFKSFIPKPDLLDSGYLAHWLRSNRKHLDGLGNGATFKEVSKAVVSRVEIPLPPVLEQRRIAEVLDRADVLRVKRREALAVLDGLAQSLFFKMFGDPMANDRGWRYMPVADFVRGFESGKNLVSDDLSDRGSRFRVLKTSAITSLRFRAEETKPVPDSYEPPARHLVREGDVLFGRANTGDLIGATALVRGVGPNVLLPDKIWRFTWPTVAMADPLWVMHLFRTRGFRREMTRRASGTSASMKNISQEKVLSIWTGLPDLELQRTYAERVTAIEASHTRQEQSRDDLKCLFRSLRERAFSGQL